MQSDSWFDAICPTLLGIALATFFPAVASAAVAGHMQFVAGDVRIVDTDGKQRPAQKGQPISEGETVLTAAGASAQLKMIDGGILALRPESQLKVDSYTFNGTADGSENALLSLVKGGLRTITGVIGKSNKEKLKLRTPTAVIGIRGTDHEPVVVLATPIGTGSPAGTYDKVNVGATSLTTQAGTAVIAANQIGYAASPTQAPVILPKLPDFYRATPPLHQEHKQAGQGGAQQGGQPSSSSTAGSDIKTDPTAAVTSAAPAATTLTGVDANGNVLNLSQQTLTTASGQTLALTSGVAVAPVGGNLLMVEFPFAPSAGNGAIPDFLSFGGSGLSLNRDGSGNLTGAAFNGGGNNIGGGNVTFGALGGSLTLSQGGASLTDFGSDAATGLAWGRWQGGQVSETAQYIGQDASGTWGLGATNSSGAFVIGGTQNQSTALGSASLHWISIDNPPSDFLPQVLTGSASYTLLGGTHPTDQNGNVGTLSSAGLNVNFSMQTADANVSFSIAGNNWVMQSGAMQLHGAQFSAQPDCAAQCISSVSVTKNGVATSSGPSNGTPGGEFAFGNMNGILTGAALNGAALQYAVQDFTPSPNGGGANNLIEGVAAFSGPAQDVNTPFRVVATSDGWNTLSSSLGNGADGSVAPPPSYRGNVNGGAQPVAAVVDSAAGLTSFIGQAAGYTAANASVTVPGPQDNGPPNTINVGTALNTNLGSTTIAGTTVSWGRWAGGTVNIYSLDGATLLGSIDNSNRSIHWLTTSALTSSFANLPLTGTATYTVVGNTDPTDFKGNVGTLNSATLSADFTNAKVNAGVNVSFNSASNTSTWNLTANNIPLSGNDGFQSDSSLNGANGMVSTVTCSGPSCSAQARGYLEGHFIAGAQGAVMLYGMATGSATTASSSNASISQFTPTNGVTGLIVMKH